MIAIRVERAAPEAAATIRALEAAALVASGHATLGDSVWRDLEHPGPDSAGFFARNHEGDPVGYVHVARSDNFSEPHWDVGLLRLPHPEFEPTGELLRTAVDHVRSHGGGRAVLWQFDPTLDADTAARDSGFVADRELYQMRVGLPLADAVGATELADRFRVRTFVPEADTAAWLEVNNRAFDNHPDQGGWIESTLARRVAEPWFDPSIFFLAFEVAGADGAADADDADARLVGFNWLKVHPQSGDEPATGEIFVIGVDPSAQGSGLGRALAVVGLRALTARGITIGMLYVAAENTSALTLYRSLGFSITRVDRAYQCEVAA